MNAVIPLVIAFFAPGGPGRILGILAPQFAGFSQFVASKGTAVH
jgi:hypothetical protein